MNIDRQPDLRIEDKYVALAQKGGVEIKEVQRLSRVAGKVLIDRIKDEIPEKGKFGKISVSFNIIGTLNSARLIYEYDLLCEDGRLRRLSVGAVRKGYDLMSSVYIEKGTNEDICAYIKSGKGGVAIAESVIKMSASVDGHMD